MENKLIIGTSGKERKRQQHYNICIVAIFAVVKIYLYYFYYVAYTFIQNYLMITKLSKNFIQKEDVACRRNSPNKFCNTRNAPANAQHGFGDSEGRIVGAGERNEYRMSYRNEVHLCAPFQLIISKQIKYEI